MAPLTWKVYAIGVPVFGLIHFAAFQGLMILPWVFEVNDPGPIVVTITVGMIYILGFPFLFLFYGSSAAIVLSSLFWGFLISFVITQIQKRRAKG